MRDTKAIDELFLELSQFTTATTHDELRLKWIAADALLLLSHATGFDGDDEETVPPIGPILEELSERATQAGVEVGSILADNAERYGGDQ